MKRGRFVNIQSANGESASGWPRPHASSSNMTSPSSSPHDRLSTRDRPLYEAKNTPQPQEEERRASPPFISSSNEASSRQDALQESQLQASFAEQTASEMKQVLSWWVQACHDGSQSELLRENSLVFASPPQSMDTHPDFTLSPNNEYLATISDMMIFSSPLCDTRTNQVMSPTLLDDVSPVLMLSPRFSTEAQKQSVVVDGICSQVHQMQRALHELEDTAVLQDDDNNESILMPSPTCLQDLPFVSRHRLHAWLYLKGLVLQLELHLSHALLPCLASTCLQSKRQHYVLFSLTAMVVALALTISMYKAQSARDGDFCCLVRVLDHYLSDDVLFERDSSFGECEFIHDVIL